MLIPLGSENEMVDSLGNILVSCSPNTIIETPTSVISSPFILLDSWNADPRRPITPPNRKNDITLPILKKTWGINFSLIVALGLSCENRPDNPSTNPPTRAIQVDTPAVSPTRSTTGKLAQLFDLIKLRSNIPRFFAIKYTSTRIARPNPNST